MGLFEGDTDGAAVVGLEDGDEDGLDVGDFVGLAVVGDEVPSSAYSISPFHIEALLYVEPPGSPTEDVISQFMKKMRTIVM